MPSPEVILDHDFERDPNLRRAVAFVAKIGAAERLGIDGGNKNLFTAFMAIRILRTKVYESKHRRMEPVGAMFSDVPIIRRLLGVSEDPEKLQADLERLDFKLQRQMRFMRGDSVAQKNARILELAANQLHSIALNSGYSRGSKVTLSENDLCTWSQQWKEALSS